MDITHCDTTPGGRRFLWLLRKRGEISLREKYDRRRSEGRKTGDNRHLEELKQDLGNTHTRLRFVLIIRCKYDFLVTFLASWSDCWTYSRV